jgi:hypothetical protein
MNLYFNLVLVCLTILIIVLCNTEYFLVDENDKSKNLRKMVGKEQARQKCDPLKDDPQFPSTRDDIYDSNMIYKYFTNGMASNLQSIYKTPQEIKKNPRFKNKPIINNPTYLVGASNEGTTALKNCEPCTYQKQSQACLDNVQIMEDDYCPQISQCNGMPEIPYSKSFKNPTLLNDNIQSITKQLERLSKKKINNMDDKNICNKKMCYIKNNPEIQERYSEFNSIYKKVNSKISSNEKQTGSISLDFLNDSDENVSNMKQFLINPMNIYYFDLPGVIYEVKNNGLTLTSKTKEEIINRTLIPEILVKKAFEKMGTYVDGSDGKYKIKISGNQVEDIHVPSHILNLGLEQMIQFSKEIYSCSRYRNEIEC